jgi:hypothetical protein
MGGPKEGASSVPEDSGSEALIFVHGCQIVGFDCEVDGEARRLE